MTLLFQHTNPVYFALRYTCSFNTAVTLCVCVVPRGIEAGEGRKKAVASSFMSLKLKRRLFADVFFASHLV